MKMRVLGLATGVVIGLGAGTAAAGQQSSASTSPLPRAVEQDPVGREAVRRDADSARVLSEGPLSRGFLDGVAALPEVEGRVFFVDPATRKWMTEEQAKKLREEERKKLKSRVCDESFYYMTRYGTPAAYVRAFDVLSKFAPEWTSWKDKRVVDFGYGTIGHLRMLAAAGATCVGVDVDGLLPLLYAGVEGETGGAVRVVDGQWPADEKVAAAVGEGFDLFISKNTLKNGYVNPEREVDPRMLVHLGVSNERYVQELTRVVKPGGYVLIYNICPAMAPADKPYVPWADGRCPFPKEMWEKNGFEVLAMDVKDDDAAREMGRRFGWDKGGEKLEESIFAWYSVMKRKGGK